MFYPNLIETHTQLLSDFINIQSPTSIRINIIKSNIQIPVSDS